MRRLPVFNWITPKMADKEKADGLYENDYQVIGIDPRISDKNLIQTIIHELLHYCSNTYPKIIQSLNEEQIERYTEIIFQLIKKIKNNMIDREIKFRVWDTKTNKMFYKAEMPLLTMLGVLVWVDYSKKCLGMGTSKICSDVIYRIKGYRWKRNLRRGYSYRWKWL